MAGDPVPAFRLELGERDLTEDLRPRLVALTVTEARGEEADQLDLTLSDHDGRLALPVRGGLITLALGWKGRALVNKGRFKIDEVEHTGAPDVVTIRARSADFTDALRVRRERSWSETTLGQVIGDLAAGNGLEARISSDLAGRAVPHLAQSRESDANLLTRLGRQYDAAATVKAGRLIFVPVGAGETARGQALPGLTLTRRDGDRHSYKAVDREAYAGVSASYHDVARGHRGTVQIPASSGSRSDSAADGDQAEEAGEMKRLRRTFASEADARTHAEAEVTRLARGAAEMSLSLALGRPELYPEQRVQVLGIKPEIDAARWLIKSAAHTLSGQGEGLTTALELETG